MFGSCQFLCLFIVWLSISFLSVSKELCIPSVCMCHLTEWHSALCPSAQITITRVEFVSLAYCIGYSPFFLFLLIADFLRKIRAFLSTFFVSSLQFYIHTLCFLILSLHSYFPIVFIINTFFLLLVLVLFIVPQSMTRPVYVILNSEQATRAWWARHHCTSGPCLSQSLLFANIPGATGRAFWISFPSIADC